MKQLLIIAFIFSSFFCFGQSKVDTITISTNVIQLEKLNAIQTKINEDNKAFADILELIFGYKIEEIESWKFDRGQFKITLKPKKK